MNSVPSSRPAPVRRTVAALVLAATALCACGEDAPEEAQLSGSEDRILGMVPEFSLTDQSGQDFGTEQLYGEVWICNFIFTRCTSTCPVQTAQLTQLQDQLQADPRWNEIRLVSISVDPEFDTPEVLEAYARNAGADPERWKFLTGSREAIWRLSRDGFHLAVADDPADASMPITHSVTMALVDQQLRIRGYFNALSDEGMTQLEDRLHSVLDERLLAPPVLADTPVWLEKLREAQLQSAADLDVYSDFQFSDRIVDSGISFRHRVVDDGGKTYKAVHYDHGTGLAVADVDGDGLLDLYFVSQAGSNELWRNLGGGRFEDITDTAGVAVSDRIGVTASFADIDNDGDPDLFVTTVRGGNILFENLGSGRFRDVTDRSGLAHVGHSSGAVFFDYDRDGLLDLFVCNVGKYTEGGLITVESSEPDEHQGEAVSFYQGLPDAFAGHLIPQRAEYSTLYRNEGEGHFADVSAAVGLHDQAWSGDAAPVDVNQDGWPDLYVLNMQGHDLYYENEEGKRFVDKSREVFPKTSWGAMGIKAFDFDNDGLVDIFITDMHSDMSAEIPIEREREKSNMVWTEAFLRSGGKSIYGNTFFKNEGNGRFAEVSDRLGAENYWPWGLSIGDLNADGYEDAFLASSMNYPFRYGINKVLLNERGERFRDSEFILGVEPRRDGRFMAAWFELDASGADREHPLAKGRSGRVVVWGALGTRSSVICDFDEDGDLDIITNEFGSRPMVLTSNLSETDHELRYLKIRLVGTSSNRDGLGATVKVTAGGRTYTRVYDGQSGYLSHSLYPLYFGLGDAEQVDSIEVHWPSGTTQTVEGPIRTNALRTITES